MTISLDAAGLFKFLAFWVAKKAGSSGKRLYLYFWMFFLLLAVAVGNVSSSFFSLSARINPFLGPRRSLWHPIYRVLYQDRGVCTASHPIEVANRP